MILKLVNNSKRLLLVSICLLRKPSSGLHLRCREIEGEGGSVCTLGGRGSNHECLKHACQLTTSAVPSRRMQQQLMSAVCLLFLVSGSLVCACVVVVW